MRDLLGIPRAPLTFHTGSKVKPPMRGPGEHFVFLAPFPPYLFGYGLKTNRSLDASEGCRAYTFDQGPGIPTCWQPETLPTRRRAWEQ